MNRIVFGTHHRCGTNLLYGTLDTFSNILNKQFTVDYLDDTSFDINHFYKSDIALSDHGRFYRFDSDQWVFVNIIRDPRDVVLSGADYHSRDVVPEDWLLKARMGDRTYHEYLREVDYHERVLREANAVGRDTCIEMVESFNYKNVITIKYEDLINLSDTKTSVNRIASACDMSVRESVVFLGSLLRHHPIVGTPNKPEHLTSTGAAERWRSSDPNLICEIESILRDYIKILGYKLSSNL